LRRLLIQADDFGLTEGVTEGILQAMREGVVTGASAMVCRPEFLGHIARLAPQAPASLGLHLQLTDGIPISSPAAIPSLVDAHGHFPRHRDQLGQPRTGEVLLEWRAQLAALRELGVEPSRLDTHHSVHVLPGVDAAYAQLARETGLPIRGASVEWNQAARRAGLLCSDRYLCLWTGRPIRSHAIPETLRVLDRFIPNPGSVELACHPGRVDDMLRARSSYADRREEELAVLCRPELRRRIEDLGYLLVGPKALTQPLAVEPS